MEEYTTYSKRYWIYDSQIQLSKHTIVIHDYYYAIYKLMSKKHYSITTFSPRKVYGYMMKEKYIISDLLQAALMHCTLSRITFLKNISWSRFLNYLLLRKAWRGNVQERKKKCLLLIFIWWIFSSEKYFTQRVAYLL